ncbi:MULTISPECIES: GTP-binding protein [unclassified Microbacterium]|uniref:GTP-binding protein n=1 Tax=unclassified Microbacterium TaxID=2609290 RepID=UPI0030173ABE
MDAVGVIAVVGACGPERLRYARRLAQLTNRAFFPASHFAGSPDPAQEAAVLASWADPAVGAVVELPDEVVATELIGTFADQAEHTRLLGLVCVVDATHLLDDLRRDDYLPLRDADSGIAAPMTARPLLTVLQIEYASTIVFVGWEALPPVELATIMALVSHLSPFARLRLDRRAIEDVSATDSRAVEQPRPGWVSMLNGDFAPHMTDPRVSAFRYEQVRPLHPGRLMTLLDRIEAGEFGTLVRSAGFCRLATRPHVTAQWEHAGRMFSLHPLVGDDRLTDDEELLAVGQDLALIGVHLDLERLTSALDDAALTDAELAAGSTAWAGFPDPFPAWQTAGDRAD